MAKGIRHSLLKQGLQFLLISGAVAALPVYATLEAPSLSALEQPSPTEEDDSPSFYGSRAVTKSPNQTNTIKIEFQRRSIAPPILPERSKEELVAKEKKTELASKAANNAIENTANDSSAKGNTANDSSAKGNQTKQVLPIASKTIPLTRKELLLASKAKQYIDRNWNKETGLIDSVQGYHHSTMWDVGSAIAAILSLEGIGMIPSREVSSKLSITLDTLENLPLYDDRLPNREYSTVDGLPSGRYSASSSNGNGWSALDVGRLLIWLEITARHKPQFSEQIETIKETWQLADAVNNKTLYGELKSGKRKHYRQEGRLGYLQYAAQGFQLSGYDVSDAYKIRNISPEIIDDELVFIDTRNLPYFTTDPYVLNAIELGRKDEWWDQLDTLFTLQKTKSAQENQLWVFAEDAMSKAPWFSYNNIFIYGRSWVSTSPGGKPVENPQVFSNKVAQGLSVLYPYDDFAKSLHNQVVNNSLSYRSIPTGLYENNAPNAAFNINTNSLVLASLWFKHRNYIPLIVPKNN